MQQLIDAGRLAAVRVGTVWAVPRSAAEVRAAGSAAPAERSDVITNE